MTIWWVVIGSAVVTAAIKGAGPIALGGRELPEGFNAVIALMAAALLAALVVTSALADGDRWSIGADTAGVAVAGLLLWRGANVVIGVLVAAAVTAGLRAL
jgi:branched-subunit amino acid transport protein